MFFCYVTPHLKGHLFFPSYNRIQDWWSNRSSLDIENVVLQLLYKVTKCFFFCVFFFHSSQLELSSFTSLYIGYSTKCFFFFWEIVFISNLLSKRLSKSKTKSKIYRNFKFILVAQCQFNTKICVSPVYCTVSSIRH